MGKAEPATLKAADFLILEALSRHPMSTRELSQALTISQTAVRARIKRFKDIGLVLQRWPDRKWTLKLIIRVETPQETAQIAGSYVPDLPAPKIQPRAVAKLASQGVQKAQEAPVAPDLTVEVKEPEYTPHKPVVEVSDKALKLSKQFKMPAHLYSMGGELNMGAMGQCRKCDRGTPFHYGERSLCPLCARNKGGR